MKKYAASVLTAVVGAALALATLTAGAAEYPSPTLPTR